MNNEQANSGAYPMQCDKDNDGNVGLTKRELIAKDVLCALIASGKVSATTNYNDTACTAIVIADCLLDQL